MTDTSAENSISASSSPGLYVHVPFCMRKCPYCDFYSVAAGAAPGAATATTHASAAAPDDATMPAWLDALSREIELYSHTFPTFDTLYIGGGTPSLLNEQEIAHLIERLRAGFAFAKGTEITIEANPDDIDPPRLAAYRGLGINRLSLGVQSFQDAELRFLRRRHEAAAAEAALSHIRDAGFANIGIDLIYGFQGQSLASWTRTLERALEFTPEHLSCYQMTIDPSTEFGRMLEAGCITAIDEESQRKFFMATSELLSAQGYIHYEISNFARAEGFISRHNHKYWRHVSYLGLGPSAHSFHNGTRWWNVRSVRDYCEALKIGKSPVQNSELLTADELALETLYLGFRTSEGVALDDLRRYRRWERALETLQRELLVRIECGRAVPTLKGFAIADRLPLAFTE